MLERICQITKTYDERFKEYYYYYEMVDSEFGTIRHRLTDPTCAFARIISEYSQRHLNVGYNLKLMFSNLAITNTYDGLMDTLTEHIWHLSDYNMNFDRYSNCLKRHTDRLKFVGKVK